MRRRRGDRPLSKDEILRAALKIVDDDGLEALTMRRLGGALDVEAMSIYGHIRNKDELLVDLMELVLADVAVVAREDPIQAAVDLAYSYRDTLLRHPNLLPLLARREARPTSGGAPTRRDAAIALAQQAGLDPEWAVLAYMTVVSFVAGHVITHRGLLGADNASAGFVGPHPDDVFKAGLDAVIQGLLVRAGRLVSAT